MGLVISVLFLSTAHAENSRPPLFPETFYSKTALDKLTQAPVWSQVLAAMGIVSASNPEMGDYGGNCSYNQALATLLDIQSQFGKESPYAKLWARNQDRTFSACGYLRNIKEPPVKPQGKNLPKRAQSDFQYQLASWYFYGRQYEKALPIYHKLSKNHKAPERPNASYMVARTLAYLKRTADAYHYLEAILADKSLQKVHGISANYRFVLMNATTWVPSEITPELAKEHLEWLLSLIEANPAGALDRNQAIKDYEDAMAQLDSYFPLYEGPDHDVDWWLDPDFVPSSPRTQAVKEMALKNDLVDWFQAKWAFNIFDHDWLWALHDQQNAYWRQNHHIVEHALEKLKKTHNGSWLQVAISRVQPMDDLAPTLVATASKYLSQDWKNETLEYRKWLLALWQHSLRIELGRNQNSAALQLITDHQDFIGLWPRTNYDWTVRDHPATLQMALRWLVYTGQISDARQFLTQDLKLYPHQFREWQTLLATDTKEALASAHAKPNGLDFYGHTGNSPEIWQNMINDLSVSYLYELATNPDLNASYRALISMTVLTRAILEQTDHETIDKYAALAAKLNPDLQKNILEGVAPHTQVAYAEFLLTMPRFRPVPYLQYANIDRFSGQYARSDQLSPMAIDQYNHNDNDWWCRFSDAKLQADLLRSALIISEDNKVLSLQLATNNDGGKSFEDTLSPDLKPYVDNQKKLLAQHPYRKLVDRDELA